MGALGAEIGEFTPLHWTEPPLIMLHACVRDIARTW